MAVPPATSRDASNEVKRCMDADSLVMMVEGEPDGRARERTDGRPERPPG